jgi:hypothetical protein
MADTANSIRQNWRPMLKEYIKTLTPDTEKAIGKIESLERILRNNDSSAMKTYDDVVYLMCEYMLTHSTRTMGVIFCHSKDETHSHRSLCKWIWQSLCDRTGVADDDVAFCTIVCPKKVRKVETFRYKIGNKPPDKKKVLNVSSVKLTQRCIIAVGWSKVCFGTVVTDNLIVKKKITRFLRICDMTKFICVSPPDATTETRERLEWFSIRGFQNFRVTGITCEAIEYIEYEYECNDSDCVKHYEETHFSMPTKSKMAMAETICKAPVSVMIPNLKENSIYYEWGL